MSSFLDQVREKESQRAAKTEAPATPAEAVETVESAIETVEAEESEETVIAESENQEITDDVRKHLSDKGSFLDNLKEKQAQKEEQLAAEAQAQEEFENEEAEEEAEEAPEPVPVKFQLGEQEFGSIEEVNTHLTAQNERFKELENEVEQIRDFVEKVSDDDMVELLRLTGEGNSLRVALVKMGFDETMFDISDEGEPDAKTLVKAQIEREEAIKARAKQQEQLRKNMESTNTNLSALQQEEGFDDKVKEQLIAIMADFQKNGLNGLVAKDSMKIFLKGLNYDKAVDKAKEAGEIKGRNEKIVIERKKERGDQIPQLGRGVSAQPDRPKPNRLNDVVNIPSGSFMDKIRSKTN